MNNYATITFYHDVFIIDVFTLLGEQILQKLSVKWHLLQGFPEGNSNFQLLENIKEARKVSLLVFFRRHQRVWCFLSRVGDSLFLSFSHQLTFSLSISTLFSLCSLTFSLFILFLIFCFLVLTYFFFSRLFFLFLFLFLCS